jgi:hypothetical protein
MRNTADVTGSKPIAVVLQSISGVRAINPLVAFNDIHGEKERGAILLFNRPTKRRKENSPSDGHCQCKIEMDYLLASQQILESLFKIQPV